MSVISLNAEEARARRRRKRKRRRRRIRGECLPAFKELTFQMKRQIQ